MTGPLTEHAIKAKPNEEGNQGQDHDYGQASVPVFSSSDHNIVRTSLTFQHRQRTSLALRLICAAASAQTANAPRFQRLPTLTSFSQGRRQWRTRICPTRVTAQANRAMKPRFRYSPNISRTCRLRVP